MGGPERFGRARHTTLQAAAGRAPLLDRPVIDVPICEQAQPRRGYLPFSPLFPRGKKRSRLRGAKTTSTPPTFQNPEPFRPSSSPSSSLRTALSEFGPLVRSSERETPRGNSHTGPSTTLMVADDGSRKTSLRGLPLRCGGCEEGETDGRICRKNAFVARSC